MAAPTILSRACLRCHVLETSSTPLTPVQGLLVCAGCAPSIRLRPCEPGQHVWRGMGAASWQCAQCGAVLPSEAMPGPGAMQKGDKNE